MEFSTPATVTKFSPHNGVDEKNIIIKCSEEMQLRFCAECIANTLKPATATAPLVGTVGGATKNRFVTIEEEVHLMR